MDLLEAYKEVILQNFTRGTYNKEEIRYKSVDNGIMVYDTKHLLEDQVGLVGFHTIDIEDDYLRTYGKVEKLEDDMYLINTTFTFEFQLPEDTKLPTFPEIHDTGTLQWHITTTSTSSNEYIVYQPTTTSGHCNTHNDGTTTSGYVNIQYLSEQPDRNGMVYSEEVVRRVVRDTNQLGGELSGGHIGSIRSDDQQARGSHNTQETR